MQSCHLADILVWDELLRVAFSRNERYIRENLLRSSALGYLNKANTFMVNIYFADNS